MSSGSTAVLAGLLALACDAADPAPTFVRDVAPIVHARCGACHRSGGSGPFPLLSYRDVEKRARQVGELVRTRRMPPWPPVPGHGTFAGARRLPEDELATLLAWVEAGAPHGEGQPPQPLDAPGAWSLGPPDVVLALEGTYPVPAEAPDAWRTFVLPVGLPEPVHVRAVELRPSGEQVVHHLIASVETTGAARARDRADPAVGYDGSMASLASLGGEAFGWVPGMGPFELPDGAATRLPAGADLVVDAHFVPRGRTESFGLEVGLYLAEEAPVRLPTGIVLVGPGATLPPGAADVTLGNAFELPVDVELFSIAPHAHFVCRRVRVWAETPDGRRVELLRIDDWDPGWQEIYRYAETVSLPRGTRVEMRFTYDNSAANDRNPFSPPRRVNTGKGATDEMAALWLNVLVEDRAELAALREACERRYREDSDRANRLIGLWTGLVEAFDADRDGSLDACEEAQATAAVDGIFEDEPRLLAGFDEDRDGRLSLAERAFVESVVAAWHGTPPEGASSCDGP